MATDVANVSDEQHALLRAVLERPEEDLVRLVYADWLEENGERDRAEFIRVQVELAATDDPHSDRFWDGQLDKGPESYRRRKSLRLREREMVKLFEWQGFRTAFGLPQHWPAWHLSAGPADWTAPPVPNWCGGVLRRGFVDEIRLPLALFLEHARDLFAAHPVTAVVLTDREPFGHTSELVSWRRSPGPDQLRDWRECLPDDLYDRLPGMPDTFAEYYRDSDKAHAALSAACTAYGRRAAGLPPLE